MRALVLFVLLTSLTVQPASPKHGVYVQKDGRWQEVLEHETVVKVDEGLGPPSAECA